MDMNNNNISRRSFLKAGTAVALGSAAIMLSSCCSAEKRKNSKTEKFLIIGSGAADYSQTCNCEICKKERPIGGKNCRFRAGYQIGDLVRIEWGPDVDEQNGKFNLKPELLRHIFITHSHDDHFVPAKLLQRETLLKDSNLITKFYGNKEVIKQANETFKGDWARYHLEPVTLEPGKTVEVSELKMKVTALLANHMTTEDALIYLFKTPNWTLLHAHDTATFPDATFELLKGAGVDVFIPDCTWGPTKQVDTHMGCFYVVDVIKRLKANGGLKENAKIVPSHFSHFRSALHDELEKHLAQFGMEPAYDGKIVELKKA